MLIRDIAEFCVVLAVTALPCSARIGCAEEGAQCLLRPECADGICQNERTDDAQGHFHRTKREQDQKNTDAAGQDADAQCRIKTTVAQALLRTLTVSGGMVHAAHEAGSADSLNAVDDEKESGCDRQKGEHAVCMVDDINAEKEQDAAADQRTDTSEAPDLRGIGKQCADELCDTEGDAQSAQKEGQHVDNTARKQQKAESDQCADPRCDGSRFRIPIC